MSIISTASSMRAPRWETIEVERIEVDADDVERLYLLLGERGEIVGAIAAGEDAAVDGGMQRLDSSAKHLWRARHVLDT